MKSFPEWLRESGLERYATVFAENDIDFSNARALSEADLRELGLTLGHRKNFLRALAALEASIPARLADPIAAAPTPAPAVDLRPSTAAARPDEEGERRQLAVLFCDMVGFTELASRVDPEILRDVIRSYEDTCAASITRYEGYVFQCQGDGIVAFLRLSVGARRRGGARHSRGAGDHRLFVQAGCFGGRSSASSNRHRHRTGRRLLG